MKLAKKIVFLLFLAILLIVCLFISNKLSSNVHQQQKHEVPPALAYPVYDYHCRAAVRHAAAGAQFLLGCRYLQYHDEQCGRH